MYGKIENGEIVVLSHRHIVLGNKRIFNPRERQLREAGYKKVVYGERPKNDGKPIKIEYEEKGDMIKVIYTSVGGAE